LAIVPSAVIGRCHHRLRTLVFAVVPLTVRAHDSHRRNL
jgi:hypothetical protein